jgi:hypothetical protein
VDPAEVSLWVDPLKDRNAEIEAIERGSESYWPASATPCGGMMALSVEGAYRTVPLIPDYLARAWLFQTHAFFGAW